MSKIVGWIVTVHNSGSYVPGLIEVFGSAMLMSDVEEGHLGQLTHYLLSKTVSVYHNMGGDRPCIEEDVEAASETLELCLANYYEKEIECREEPRPGEIKFSTFGV